MKGMLMMKGYRNEEEESKKLFKSLSNEEYKCDPPLSQSDTTVLRSSYLFWV